MWLAHHDASQCSRQSIWALLFRSLPLLPSTGLCRASDDSCQHKKTQPSDTGCVGGCGVWVIAQKGWISGLKYSLQNEGWHTKKNYKLSTHWTLWTCIRTDKCPLSHRNVVVYACSCWQLGTRSTNEVNVNTVHTCGAAETYAGTSMKSGNTSETLELISRHDGRSSDLGEIQTQHSLSDYQQPNR